MQKRPRNVAVVGATGAVGEEMMKILQQREFPVARLLPLASARSAGGEVTFRGEEWDVEELTHDSFEGIDIALFSAGGGVSQEFAPSAADAGAVVIDNTSAFRMEQDIPLVVPEVNPHQIKNRPRGIIANPNCSTIQMVLVLKPLHDLGVIKRVVVSTYQAVSGAGKRGIEELSQQTRDIFAFQEVTPDKFSEQIAFNCLPHIDVFMEDGSTKEEWKLMVETKKIMEDDGISVVATCVRVPVFHAHSEAVNIEFELPVTVEEAREALSATSGVEVVDDPDTLKYPHAIMAAGRDETFVGRIRRDETIPSGLNLWIVSDNIRKGAALNAVQIAEKVIEEK